MSSLVDRDQTLDLSIASLLKKIGDYKLYRTIFFENAQSFQ